MRIIKPYLYFSEVCSMARHMHYSLREKLLTKQDSSFVWENQVKTILFGEVFLKTVCPLSQLKARYTFILKVYFINSQYSSFVSLK